MPCDENKKDGVDGQSGEVGGIEGAMHGRGQALGSVGWQGLGRPQRLVDAFHDRRRKGQSLWQYENGRIDSGAALLQTAVRANRDWSGHSDKFDCHVGTIAPCDLAITFDKPMICKDARHAAWQALVRLKASNARAGDRDVGNGAPGGIIAALKIHETFGSEWLSPPPAYFFSVRARGGERMMQEPPLFRSGALRDAPARVGLIGGISSQGRASSVST